MRPDIDSAKADWNGPYYDSMRSPSYEKLEATFFAVEYE
jgi:hypothetical protein